MAGTDPTHAAGAFCVLNGGAGWLDLSAVTGRPYRINGAPSPGGPWSNVTAWTSWTGGTMRVSIPAEPCAYRPSVRQGE